MTGSQETWRRSSCLQSDPRDQIDVYCCGCVCVFFEFRILIRFYPSSSYSLSLAVKILLCSKSGAYLGGGVLAPAPSPLEVEKLYKYLMLKILC